MNEINFIHMHKTVVTEVISTTVITKSISMMKLNSMVRRSSPLNVEQDELETPNEATQSKAVRSKQNSTKTPTKRGKKQKHGKVLQASVTVAQPSAGPDVMYVPKFCEVAMQTVTEEELMRQEEEYFQRENIERAQQLLMVDFIKEEDFDSEYPPSEAGK